MSKELSDIEVSAWKIQFNNIFSLGRGMIEKSICARLLNKDPSKNFSPELKQIFLKTLEEFILENNSHNLQDILDQHTLDILGEELNQCDLTSG